LSTWGFEPWTSGKRGERSTNELQLQVYKYMLRSHIKDVRLYFWDIVRGKRAWISYKLLNIIRINMFTHLYGFHTVTTSTSTNCARLHGQDSAVYKLCLAVQTVPSPLLVVLKKEPSEL
jgi:hypothetical protein